MIITSLIESLVKLTNFSYAIFVNSPQAINAVTALKENTS